MDADPIKKKSHSKDEIFFFFYQTFFFLFIFLELFFFYLKFVDVYSRWCSFNLVVTSPWQIGWNNELFVDQGNTTH